MAISGFDLSPLPAMKLLICILIAFDVSTNVAHTQVGVPWGYVPRITVIAAEGDARLILVDEAISYWKQDAGRNRFRLSTRSRHARYGAHPGNGASVDESIGRRTSWWTSVHSAGSPRSSRGSGDFSR